MCESWIDGCVEFFPAGGMVGAAQWEVLAKAASASASGVVQVLPQAGIRLVGVDVEGVRRALPQQWSVRDVVVLASPLAGRRGRDVRPVVRSVARELDSGRLARVQLGKVLHIGVDDGSGDVADVGADVVLVGGDEGFGLRVGQTVVGQVPTSRVVDTVVEVVQAAQQGRQVSWEAMHWVDRETVNRETVEPGIVEEGVAALNPVRAHIGWLEQDGGLVSVGMGVPAGRMDAQVARLLAAIGRPTTITPWAGVVIHDLEEGEAEAVLRFLAPRGMVFDANSAVVEVSACVGRPACPRALSDVLVDVGQAVRGQLPEGRVHFAGCGLRCDAPLGAHTCYVAVAEGEYDITSIS